ncbi:ABC transporter permease [Nocardioides sediminis]|uniref:ABC transporter permease n=1 Tax=Nocardioides sediminis TaxID=433648 RepID=UPI000D322650|nr:ABC transporter permease [Nocardioides sediminis]
MRALRAMTWVELKLFVREPLTVMFVLVLPLVVLYVLNGVFGSQPDPTVWEGLSPIDFYTSAYVALVAATAGVLSLPVHLAGYREQGVLRRFRASAVRPAALVGAHMTVTVVIATVGAVLLSVLSVVVYDAALPEDWLGVVAAYLVTAVAFAALGALLGFLLPTARAAQGLGVLLFFVFMMLGGAGPPKEVLPTALSRVADGLPVTYASDLVRGPWMGQGWDGTALLVLVVMLVACVGLTAWRLRRETEG